MPRFLNTLTGEFEWHGDPRTVSYAILSHTWRSPQEGGEQSYQDVRRIQETARERLGVLQVPAATDASPVPAAFTENGSIFSYPELSEKIKAFCRLARDDGFRLVWSDICCIDKTSSAELSDAINSMYEWYRYSDMCYVYLADVSDEEKPQDLQSTFRKSRWHGRGWTLQELIAPERLQFRTQTWGFLGTKIGLASTLESITGVDVVILTGQATMDSVSVARRMSWAAKRETTRIEDQAYCLLGIFSVHMATIYGEGKNAFLRLQEEIIKMTPDQSIFAWGNSFLLQSLDGCDGIFHRSDTNSGLLAPSPLDFNDSHSFRPVKPPHFASHLSLTRGGEIPPVHCLFTPQGVRMQLLCLRLPNMPQASRALSTGGDSRTCSEFTSLSQGIVLAVLQCEDHDGSLIMLPLYLSPSAAGDKGISIGTHISCSNSESTVEPYHTVRLSRTGLAEAVKLHRVLPGRIDVSIRRYSDSRNPKVLHLLGPTRSESSTIALWPGDRPDSIPFDIAPHSIDALRALGFSASPLQVARSEREITLCTTLTYAGDKDHMPPDGGLPQTIELRLSLTRQPEAAYSDTKALFAVVNFLDDHSDKSVSLSPSHRSEFSHESEAVSSWTTRRISASAEFLVLSDNRGGTYQIRLLRIVLECQLESSVTPDPNQRAGGTLSIELSEPFLKVPPTESATNDREDSTHAAPSLESFISNTTYNHDEGSQSTHATTTATMAPVHPDSQPPHNRGRPTYPQSKWLSAIISEPPISTTTSTGVDESLAVDPVRRNSVEGVLHQENAALRAQNSAMSAQVDNLVSKNTEVSTRLTEILARLDALQAAPKVADTTTTEPGPRLRGVTSRSSTCFAGGKSCVVM